MPGHNFYLPVHCSAKWYLPLKCRFSVTVAFHEAAWNPYWKRVASPLQKCNFQHSLPGEVTTLISMNWNKITSIPSTMNRGTRLGERKASHSYNIPPTPPPTTTSPKFHQQHYPRGYALAPWILACMSHSPCSEHPELLFIPEDAFKPLNSYDH